MASTDVEDESILANIFKDSFPENWRESSDFLQYLTELSSFGVEKLSKEPERLSEERAQVLEETQELAFHNYKTFIQTAECSREIFEDFQIIEKHVGGMLEKLPLFSEACNNFLNSAQDISGNRRMNSVTLQRHTQLLEILEVPQLMDTCVRNGYYDEALELAQHVRRWEKKYANIPVIVNIVEEVKGSTQLMLKQLIQQLRTNLQLPACLRVIGYLRRMDVFTEPELRIKFLQARDAWFQGILEGIAKDDAYNHIQKTVEMSRVHLFDIITQYRAIFSDEDLTPIGDTPNESALFHGWVVEKVSQFLHTLETDLQRGLGGRLDSILGQCMYFGLSFSRVGADFRGLLAPIFQQAALQSFQLALVDANRRFEESMQSYSLLTSTSTVSGMAYTSGSQAGQLYPPTSLLDFHPLAALCNDILTAFNELRLCAPISLAVDVAMAIQSALIEVNKVILGFHRAEESAFDDREREQFGRFCEAYAGDLLPYLNKALNSLFPPAQLCQMLGVTQPQLGKMKNMGVVDKKAVISSIEHLIPVAPDNPEVTDVTPEAMSVIIETTTGQKKAAEAVTSEEEQKPTSAKDSELLTPLVEPGASDAGGSAEDKPVTEEPTKGDNSAAGTDTAFSDTSSQPVRKGSDSVMEESLTKQAEISEQPEPVTGIPGVFTVPTVDSLDEKKQD